MKPIYFLLTCFLLLSACGPAPEVLAAQTAQASTATAALWTPTPTATPTITPTPVGLISAGSCKSVQEIRRVGDGSLNMLTYSADGRWLAAATSSGVTVYDTQAFKIVWSAKTGANLTEIAFTPQSETLSGVDAAFTLYQWQVTDGRQLLAKKPADINELPMAFALSPDGSFLAVPAYDDSIHLYKMSDASLSGKIEQFLFLGETPYAMSISPDAKRMVTISLNGDLRFWSIPDKKMRGVLESKQNERPIALNFAPDGKLVVNFETNGGDTYARILDPASQTWVQKMVLPVAGITAGKLMFNPSQSGIDLRRFGSDQPSSTLPEQSRLQGRAASSPDGTSLAVGTAEGIHIWRLADASLTGSIPARYTSYSSLAVSADGTKLAAGNNWGIELLNPVDGTVIQTLKPENKLGPYASLVLSPGGELLAGAVDKTVYVWDLQAGRQLWEEEMEDSFTVLAFSPDGSLLAGGYYQSQSPIQFGDTIPGRISVWESRGGDLTQELDGGGQILTPGYSSLAFSADGRYLLAAQSGGDIELWLTEDWSLSKVIKNESIMAWNPRLAFAPDGKSFISGGMDRTIQVWKAPEGDKVRSIQSGKGTVEALAFSPDGEMFASSIMNDIDLWDAGSGAHLCKISGSSDLPTAIFFTNDQHTIVSLSKDGVLTVWGLP
ncbi:MAG: hypothetical protein HZB50_00405 [Chloroflexi bacterium]|nr:hypothetical protein [Chloroflexota bacterium]